MAETINETVVSVIAEKNSTDPLSGAIKSETVCYDDGSDISDEVNRILKEKYGYRNMVWYSDATGFSGRTVCSADGENIGSYPVIVPENIHIAPDQDYLSDMNSSSFSWENYFCSTTELNSKIKNMARGIDAAVAAAFRKEMISENDMQESKQCYYPVCKPETDVQKNIEVSAIIS